nr:facilitated trehalose transporter Tret1-like [Leptinotarsa decemlineata]
MDLFKPKCKKNSTENYSVEILAVIIASLSSLTNGIFFSWPSPFILKISKDKENYDISEEEASKFAMLPFIFVMLSCPIFSRLGDIFGRKRILLLTAFVDLAVWILKAYGRNVFVFYFARILVGISDGIMFATLPAYLGEVSSPNVRGTWGNSMSVSFLTGELLVTVVGSYFNVWQTSYIFIPIPIVFFVFFSFLPESPYFYMMRGRYDDAKKSLQKLRQRDDVTADFLSLKADVDRQMSEKGTWKETLMIRSNRRALAAGIFLRISQVFGGAQAFVTFTQYIFNKSVGTISAETSSIIFISIGLLLSLFASFAGDWFGRRKAYIGSLFPCGLVLFFEAIYFFIHQEQPDIDISSYHWVPLFGMILYSIFSSYGINIMPTLMLGELFSASFRAKAMTVVLITTGTASFSANALFYFFSSNYGLYAPFLFFGFCNMVSTILCYFILPETKNRTLEEIQQLLKRTRPQRPEKKIEKLMDGSELF